MLDIRQESNIIWRFLSAELLRHPKKGKRRGPGGVRKWSSKVVAGRRERCGGALLATVYYAATFCDEVNFVFYFRQWLFY